MGRSGERDEGPNAREVEAALRARVDQLVPELLSGARPDGAFWCAGSVAGDAGQSLKVNRRGAYVGLWTDWSAAEGSDEYSGDMLKLICVVHFGGWRKGDEARANAIGWAKSWLGWTNLDRSQLKTIKQDTAAAEKRAREQAQEEAARKLKSAIALWSGAVPIADTAAERYLETRGIALRALGRAPGSLRFVADAWCSVRRSKHPAMVACIMRRSALAGVHRTYLDVSAGRGGPVTAVKVVKGSDGLTRLAKPGEPRAKSHKASMGIYLGGCIPLWKGTSSKTLFDIPDGTAVYVSEGIEDGLSVALARPDLRVVAGVALANMGRLELPLQAGKLVFIGQNDPVTGRAVEAFERTIARQQEAARTAKRPMPEIMWPQPQYKDFNDQLLGKVMAQ